MEAPLTVFYTARLQGDLAFAPRLYTLLKALRERAPGPTLLLDLGESCIMQQWHCAVTGGRSALFALDAMGYDAANASALHPDNRARMQPACHMRLIGPGQHARLKGTRLFVPPENGNPARLSIALAPAVDTLLQDGLLLLASVDYGQVGAATVDFGPGGAGLAGFTVTETTANLPPDPTITGAVEFILSEAAYVLKQAQQRRGPT